MRIRITPTLRMNPLTTLKNGYPQSTRDALTESGDAMVADIRASWSGYYPPASEPGKPPAVRSGTLDAGVTAVENMSAGSGTVFQITITASAISENGYDYAPALEFGTVKMAARSFLRPAAKRSKDVVREKMKTVFDKVKT